MAPNDRTCPRCSRKCSSLKQSISFIGAYSPSLRAYRHQSEPGTCEQRRDKKGLRDSLLGFAAQVGPERCPVCRLASESALTRLVLLLSGDDHQIGLGARG